jgi:hypothetical protein
MTHLQLHCCDEFVRGNQAMVPEPNDDPERDDEPDEEPDDEADEEGADEADQEPDDEPEPGTLYFGGTTDGAMRSMPHACPVPGAAMCGGPKCVSGVLYPEAHFLQGRTRCGMGTS